MRISGISKTAVLGASLLVGCQAHRPTTLAWQPAPGTLAASYRLTRAGLEAAFELPKASTIAVVQIDPAGRFAILGAENRVLLELPKGLHQLRFAVDSAPRGGALPYSKYLVDLDGNRSRDDPARRAGVRSDCVPVMNSAGQVVDHLACGATGFTVNQYAGPTSEAVNRRQRRVRAKPDRATAGQVILIAFDGGVGVEGFRAAISQASEAVGGSPEKLMAHIWPTWGSR